MLQVLSHLTGLRIRGEYSSDVDVGYLDNTSFLAATTNNVVLLDVQHISSSQIKLEWPALLQGYQVQMQDILSPADWLPVPTSPVVTDGMHQVILNITNNSRFFRLVKP